MIATLVFTMGILGVYAMMIKSYELVTLSRHRDNARAFLMSFSDQFLRLQTTDLIAGVTVLRPLFATNGTGGDGLTWTNPAGVQVNGSTLPYLTVTLGDSGSSQIPAQVSRQVTYLDSTGTPTTTQTTTAAGWLLQGTFTIQYAVNGRTQTQSITVCRSVR
jgi:Tfp pilus assembly protein PilV